MMYFWPHSNTYTKNVKTVFFLHLIHGVQSNGILLHLLKRLSLAVSVLV